MKKPALCFLVIPLAAAMLTGCEAVPQKNTSFSILYGACAVISLLLLVGCLCSVRKKRFWIVTLFSSVLTVNVGYTLLALSSSLDAALWANRLSYLGSVFLPLSMLMIVLEVTNTKYKSVLPKILVCLSAIVFLIAASPGILDIYYKEVSYEVVDGAARLVKVYGALHPLYLIYLVSYFTATVYVIVRAAVKKTVESTMHSVILASAVLVNIGVWFIEQISDIDFEMLSVSYIISELFILGVHLVMNENTRLREIVRRVECVREYPSENASASEAMLEKPIDGGAVSPETVELFINGMKTLTPSEKAVCDAYIARVTTKEIMENLKIKESTLKYHSRNLYSKLGVSSRKELLEMHKHVKNLKADLKAED